MSLELLRPTTRQSFARRITLGALLLSLAFVGALGAGSYLMLRDILLDRARGELNFYAFSLARQFERQVSDLVHDINRLADNALVSNVLIDPQVRGRYFADFAADFDLTDSALRQLCVNDFLGRPLVCKVADRQQSFEGSPWVSHVIENSGGYRELMVEDGEVRLLIVRPVEFLATGLTEGMLTAEIDLGAVIHGLVSTYLSRADNAVHRGQLTLLNGYGLPLVNAGNLLLDPARQLTANLPLGGELVASGLSLQVSVDANTAYAELQNVTVLYVLLGMVVLLLVVWFSMMIGRRVVRPLHHLCETVDGFAESRIHDFEVPHFGEDEIGKLATSFRDMVRRLRRLYATLEQRVDERTHDLLSVNAQLTHEVEQRREAEKQLQQAKEIAEQASRAKSDFLANITHELRTPLNGVIGMLEELDESRLEAEHRVYVATALTAGRSLLTLVDDLLDYSRLERHRLELEPAPFDLYERIRTTLQRRGEVGVAKGVEVAALWPPELPRYVVGDGARLGQALGNLIDNACKFTDRGSVLVTVDVAAFDNTEIRLRFRVTDTGIGVEESVRDSIFEQFSQSDRGTTRRYGGAGLGLTLSRDLVTLMGGEIGLEPRKGGGTVFWFSVPLALDAGRDQPAWQPGGHRVALVAAKRTGEILGEGLRQLGAQVTLESISDWRAGKVAADADITLVDLSLFEHASLPLSVLVEAHRSGIGGSLFALEGLTEAYGCAAAKAAGLDGCLGRPCSSLELAALLRGELFQQQQEENDVVLVQEREVLDPLVIRELQELLGEQFDGLVSNYLEDADRHISTMVGFARQDELEQLSGTAHTLKGSSANVGALGLAQACDELRQAVTARRTDLLPAMLERVNREYEMVKRQLESTPAVTLN